jgi:catechol 2,3-dioxygenase-like lactoylglutathione lyase family enzyme
MTKIRTLGLDHIDLSVGDMETSVAFYDSVLPALGFVKTPEEGTIVWRNEHMEIGVRPATADVDGNPVNRYRIGMHHLALRAASRADVDAFHEFLVSHKLEVLDPPALYPVYGSDYYAVFFADPDGIKLELVYRPWV